MLPSLTRLACVVGAGCLPLRDWPAWWEQAAFPDAIGLRGGSRLPSLTRLACVVGTGSLP
eukprot:1176343-Prorocentrum_minimum.AAC.2